MTGRKNADRKELDRLAAFLVEDILEASDDDILAEAREDGVDPQADAARLRALFERTVLDANKRRLLAARAAVQAERSSGQRKGSVFDIQEARRRLQSILEQKGTIPALTLAARNENELSDADVLSMVQDLEELGVLPPDKK
ncbi:MAG: hypothetical protein KIT25_03770 [Enhydrobacter sp.]|nr:MAG: hypothetical protein KIT25_03770 [Enhydrobacter sp.]